MSSLFDNICEIEDPEEIYYAMERNYPGSPHSQSTKLWRKCGISSHNPRPETMLEKAVANLADSCHMPEWFNQCLVAPGIVDPYSDNKRVVSILFTGPSQTEMRGLSN